LEITLMMKIRATYNLQDRCADGHSLLLLLDFFELSSCVRRCR
jgi:hypothetical protein